MSYILDALRKADRDRSLGEVPDLEAAHWGIRRHDQIWRWWWVVALLLVFNALLLVYVLHRNAGTSQLHVSRPVTQPAATAAGPPATNHVGTLPETDAATASPNLSPAETERVQIPVVAEQHTQADEMPRLLRPRVAVQPHTGPVQTPDSADEPVSRVVHSPVPLTDEPQVELPEAPVAPTQAVLAGGEVPAVPELNELPLSLRSQFAMPRVDVYVYAEEPQRRFILVNLRKYREGDTLEGGIVLEKIGANSLQFNYQGTRFRLDR